MYMMSAAVEGRSGGLELSAAGVSLEAAEGVVGFAIGEESSFRGVVSGAGASVGRSCSVGGLVVIFLE